MKLARWFAPFAFAAAMGFPIIFGDDTVANKTSKETLTRTIEDGGTGPHKAIVANDESLPTHAIYRPDNLSSFGKETPLPLMVWGNGACANSSKEHQNFLSEIASHGYLVIAIGPLEPEQNVRGSRTKSSQLVDGIDWAIAQNENQSSVYYGKIATNKIAVGGMSCGGLQALEVSTDPRVSTTLVCNSGIIGGGNGSQPASNPPAGSPPRRPGGMPGMPAVTKDLIPKLHAPVLYLLGGESDIAYKNGMDDFERIDKIPAFVANMDVGHGGTYGRPHGGEFATVALGWLNWQLKSDQVSAKLFTTDNFELSKSDVWKVDRKNID